MPRRSWLAAVVILSALAVAMMAVSHAHAAACHTSGASPFPAPDNRCTPGAFVHKAKADVCDGQTVRPDMKISERRAILTNYGVPGWSHADGELDHRVPLVLGGLTNRRNVWPERGPDPLRHENPKDALERVILRRVCKGLPYPMQVTTAVRVFLADWRPAFTYYVQGIGPRPTA
jgi:hypothetical protein